MTHPVHIFDHESTNVLTRQHLEQRIVALETENRKLRSVIARRSNAVKPAEPLPSVH